MKIRNTIAKFFVAGAVLLCGASCTDNYLDYNKNPYEPDADDMKPDGYLVNALTANLQDLMMPEGEGFSQYVDALMSDNFSGYIADSNLGTGWSGRYATYNMSDAWAKIPFNDFYEKFYPTYFQLKNQVDNELYLSLAELFRIVTFLRVTDTFGPIPYSEVGVGSELSAGYDSQKEVYTKMFADLDAVIEVLTRLSNSNFNAGGDRIYGGNTAAWAKFANSVKLRMAMRVVYADEALAKTKAEEAVNSEAGVMTAAADGAYRKVADHNPWQRFMVMWNDSRISADLTCYMNGYNDPRREVYYGKSTFAAEGGDDFTGTEDYVGLRRGIEQGKYNPWSHGYSAMKVTETTDIVVFRASEAAFLRAEGALRGWNMGGTAQELYEAAVAMSFEECGVAGAAAAYLADGTSIPQAYKDPLKGQPSQAFDYSGTVGSTITVAWDEAAGFETNLERIITQKWIAMFPNGMEAWSEYRRTGYPKLMPVAANLSNGVVGTDLGARRLPYPVDEYSQNKEFVTAAVQDLIRESVNKTGDNMATRVWWDCKPAN